MKIAMADNNSLRFCHFMKDHWENEGHEVKFEMGASEHLAQWADVYYVEWYDHNIHYLYNFHRENPTAKKPMYVVRAIDWDVWTGVARDPEMGAWIDKLITITPHIRQKLLDENPGFREDQIALIRCGIHVDQFPWRPPKNGTNIVMPVNEIDWILKGGLEGLKIFAMVCKRDNRDWQLYVRGKWCQQPYIRVAFEDFVKKAGLEDKVHWQVARVPSMNDFLEDMDYVLVPSLKEAFSYVTAEAVAKGIKPVLNHWYHAEDTWKEDWLYMTPDEAVDMILEGYTEEQSKEYSDFVTSKYDAKRMMREIDEFIGIK